MERIAPMGFSRRKLEDQRLGAAEKEAANQCATDAQVLEHGNVPAQRIKSATRRETLRFREFHQLAIAATAREPVPGTSGRNSVMPSLL